MYTVYKHHLLVCKYVYIYNISWENIPSSFNTQGSHLIWRANSKVWKPKKGSFSLFREDFGLLGCKQVLELHIPMLFIFPCITIIAYQLHRFASRIHHSIITSNSCALRQHRELHLRILPTALSLLSIKEMCQHHSCIRVLSPSLDQFLKRVLSRLRLGRSLWVLLDGKLVSSFVPPWHLFQPSMQTLP